MPVGKSHCSPSKMIRICQDTKKNGKFKLPFTGNAPHQLPQEGEGTKAPFPTPAPIQWELEGHEVHCMGPLWSVQRLYGRCRPFSGLYPQTLSSSLLLSVAFIHGLQLTIFRIHGAYLVLPLGDVPAGELQDFITSFLTHK